MLRLKIPSTSANIGPGFDCCGLALSLYNYYEISICDQLIIEGCDKQYQNQDNLFYQAFKRVYDYCDLPAPFIHLKIEANIPVSRGLGSSAACIVGGLLAANALLDYRLSKQEIFMLANKMEGHPDNVAPALFGGLCVSFIDKNIPYTLPYQINPDILFTALIPSFELSTKEARSVLPKTIEYQDAVFNIGRVALLLKCLENKDLKTLKVALVDKLHEPYRSKLIDEYSQVKAICEKFDACGFYISGAGPTLMAINEFESFSKNITNSINSLKNNWQILPLRIETDGAFKINGGNYGR